MSSLKRNLIGLILIFFLIFVLAPIASAETVSSGSDGSASASIVIGGVLNLPQNEPDYMITIPSVSDDSTVTTYFYDASEEVMDTITTADAFQIDKVSSSDLLGRANSAGFNISKYFK